MIKFKRGVRANLPTLNVGEPAFTTDTNDFFIGNGTTNIEFIKYNSNALSSFTSSIKRGQYQVSVADSSFPYPYGTLFILESQLEKTAIFQATGTDRNTYINYYIDGTGWVGWSKIVKDSDFTSSLGQNGWRKNGIDGVIEQWGQVTLNTGVVTSVTFPIAFPNLQFQPSVVIEAGSGVACSVGSLTKTGMTLVQNSGSNLIAHYKISGY